MPRHAKYPYIDDFVDNEVYVFSTIGQGPVGPKGEKGDVMYPEFADPIDWDKGTDYPENTVVLYDGASYLSKQAVPHGIEITDTRYWVLTNNYNAQVEQYRQEVLSFVQQGAQVYNSISEMSEAANIESNVAIVHIKESIYNIYDIDDNYISPDFINISCANNRYAHLRMSSSMYIEQFGYVSDSINEYVSFAYSNGVKELILMYEYVLSDNLELPDGCSIVGKADLTPFNTRSIVKITDSSIILNGNNRIKGLFFEYPSGGDTTQRVPTIINTDSHPVRDVFIENCFFYKAYIAIDMGVTNNQFTGNGRIFISKIRGCALYRGFNIGHHSDFNKITDVFLHAVYVLLRENSSPIYDTIASYMMENLIYFNFVGRCDWDILSDVGIYNPHIGFNLTADASGVPNRIEASNAFIDACDKLAVVESGYLMINGFSSTQLKAKYLNGTPVDSTRTNYLCTVSNDGRLMLCNGRIQGIAGDGFKVDGTLQVSDIEIVQINFYRIRTTTDVFLANNGSIINANNVTLLVTDSYGTYRRFIAVNGKTKLLANNLMWEYLDRTTDVGRIYALGINPNAEGYALITGCSANTPKIGSSENDFKYAVLCVGGKDSNIGW